MASRERGEAAPMLRWDAESLAEAEQGADDSWFL